MTRLSVNINKVATLRNARGGDLPDVIQVAKDLERFGAQGITVHPRPDERHIRYEDVRQLKQVVTTELNVEGNPRGGNFIELILEIQPDQVTLVPDSTTQLTSDHGWDTVANGEYLTDIIAQFKESGIRTSIFVDPDVRMIEGAVETGTDRVELYTESYAAVFDFDRENAVKAFVEAGRVAVEAGLELNAGHDLNLHNLKYFNQQVKNLSEVSIGHAFIADALYYGLENTVGLYLRELR